MVDIKKSYWRLEKAGLKDKIEALFMTSQEQALSTRALEARVSHTRQDLGCRLGKEASETLQHIVTECWMQASTAYMEYHNQVAGILYRNIRMG